MNTKETIDEKALSADGYLIDQRHTQNIRYGRLSSDYNGCGWMAAFNLLKAAGKEVPALQVRDALERGLVFKGWLGTGPLHLRRYLKSCGCKLTANFRTKTAVVAAATCKAGIVYYVEGREPHYVAFYPAAGGQLRFLNAISGKQRHLSSMAAFLARKRPVRWFCVMTLPAQGG